MGLILDTHVLLWVAAALDRLPTRARELIEDPSERLFYSAASIREVAIVAIVVGPVSAW